MSSTLISLLIGVNAFLSVMVVIAACDYLRRIRPMDEPLLAVAFYLVAIGAFGAFILAMNGHVPSLYGLCMNLGVVLYVAAHRG